MAEFVQPDKVVFLDALPRLSRATEAPWRKIAARGRISNDGIATDNASDTSRARAACLLVVDDVLGPGHVDIAQQSRWLKLPVNQSLAIAACIQQLRFPSLSVIYFRRLGHMIA